MRKKLKIYCIFVIAFAFLLAYFELKNSDYKSTIENFEFKKQSCAEYLNLSEEEKNKYDIKHPGLHSVESCEYITKSNEKPVSFFLIYENLYESSIIKFIFPLFVPIILLFPIVYELSLELNSSYIKYFSLRKKYKYYILHLFKSSYKYLLPILIILIMFIIGCAIKSNFNFNPKFDLYLYLVDESSLLFLNNKINYIIYFAVIIFNLLSYINIALIVLRSNNRNFLISYVETFVLIYVWWCITFIIVGNLLSKYMGIASEEVNIMEIYRWHGIENGNTFLIANVIYYVISLIIVLLMYKNKEKTIIKCEG